MSKIISPQTAMVLDSMFGPAGSVRSWVNDAAPSIFFERELERIFQQTFDRRYPELRGRDFVPPSPDPVGPGEERYTFRSWDRRGAWRVITQMSENIPNVNVMATEQTGYVRRIANGARWSLDELERSAAAGKPLSTLLTNAAMDIIQEGIDETIAIGLVNQGVSSITGLLNNVNVTAATVVTSAGSKVTWDDKLLEDPRLILNDIFTAYNAIPTLTKEVEKPNRLLLPPSAMRLLQQQNRSTATDRTILEELAVKMPGVTIDEWNRLETAGSGSTRRGMFYRYDQKHLWVEIPQEPVFTPLRQIDDFNWGVVLHARVGGVVMPYPLSARYFDGF